MIKITSFGSGSSGNGYLIDDGHSQLMIECGVKFELVKRKMKFDLSRVAGLFISHEHGDHAKEINKVLSTTNLSLYASNGTLQALKIPDYRSTTLKVGYPETVDSWTVKAFDIDHDAAEPMGFIFENQMNERLLFITDTRIMKYRFKGITHMMVEANYSMQLLVKKYTNQEIIEMLKNRIINSHMEFENTKELIKTNQSDQLKEIWLLHLSDSNSDEELFKQEIQALTGVPVYIA